MVCPMLFEGCKCDLGENVFFQALVLHVHIVVFGLL